MPTIQVIQENSEFNLLLKVLFTPIDQLAVDLNSTPEALDRRQKKVLGSNLSKLVYNENGAAIKKFEANLFARSAVHSFFYKDEPKSLLDHGHVSAVRVYLLLRISDLYEIDYFHLPALIEQAAASELSKMDRDSTCF